MKGVKEMALTEEQIERLYLVFDFEDYEEIICADYDNGEMDIAYIDNRNGAYGHYQPYFKKHSKEDKEKLNLILNGITLNRG